MPASACSCSYLPTPLRSSWVYFEAGHDYSKGIRVVPVGVLGVDLVEVPPPLSLLQGFNIRLESSPNSIIAVLNGVFAHKHVEAFTAQLAFAVAVFAEFSPRPVPGRGPTTWRAAHAGPRAGEHEEGSTGALTSSETEVQLRNGG